MKVNNVRFFVAAITTFSAYAVYLSRVNLSIAIIAMVEDHHSSKSADSTTVTKLTNQTAHPLELHQQATSTASNRLDSLGSRLVQDESGNSMNATSLPNNWTPPTSQAANQLTDNNNNNNTSQQQHQESLTTFFPLKDKKSLRTPLISREKFDWDQAEQGHILGAFFYGYILFQIPGARMAESVGARWIIMAATCGSGLISLAFPLSTQLNSIYLLMLLRFVMGLCQSAFFPAAYVLFCRWLPERERSILLPVMFIGSNIGSISTYILSSYLISSDFGWPSVFHVSGLVCLLVSASWCIFGSNGPEDNWLITDEERKMIARNANNQSSESNSFDELPTKDPDSNTLKKLEAAKLNKQSQRASCCDSMDSIESPPPQPKLAREPSWPKLFKSIPIWTLILSMYGNEWSNVVLCYQLPTYLNTALNYPIERNGVINSFFQLSYVVVSPIMSSLGAYMLDRRTFGMHKIHVRKLFQSLATFGQLICFMSVPICGSNEGLIVLFMFASIVFRACANAGDIMVAGDLSPEYAGTIFAFANSVGNTAGFFVPLLAGFIVKNGHDRDQWTPFWITTGCIMGCSGMIFLIFGETRRQDFSADSSLELNGLGENQMSVGVETDKPISSKQS